MTGLSTSQSPEVWAARISECWRQSTESIIRTGHMLNEAKHDVGHGGWGAVLAGLPFGDRHAQMLMAIASDIRLSNPQRIALLPPSWGAIYDISRLDDDALERGFQQGIIRPDMIRADVDQIRALTRPQPKSDTGEPVGYELPSNAGMDGDGDTPLAAGSPVSVDRQSVDQGDQAPLPNGARAIMGSRVEPSDSLDFFPTPPWATRALIEHVFAHLERKGQCKFQEVWEPACGEGHMAEPLGEYFRRVFASDKADYGHGNSDIDFLDATTAHHFDWIITNPPFGDQTESFVHKAIKLAGTGVAMFVRLQWLESVGRYERIFRDKPPTLIAFFAERVPLHSGRWESDGSTATAYIWLVWLKGAEPRAPFWIPPGCRESLTKPEDIKRFGKSVAEAA